MFNKTSCHPLFSYIFPLVFICTLIVILLWLEPISFNLDFWVHGASIEILAHDTDNPVHPYLYDGMPERHLGLYEYILSRFSLLFDISGAETLLYASCFNLILLCFACLYLAKTIHHSPWFSSMVFMIITFGWGATFSWSNDYAFHILPKTAGYPSTLATILIMFLYGAILRDFENPKLCRKVIIILLATLILITHQLTSFLLMFPLMFFLIAFAPIPLKRKVIYISLGLSAMIISLFWPYYHWLTLLTKSFTGITAHRRPPGSPWMFYNWQSIIKAIGPGLLGFAFIPFLFRKKTIHLLLFLFAMLILWSLSFFIRIPLGHRTVYGCIFALHLIIIHSTALIFSDEGNRLKRKIVSAVILLTCISGFTISAYKISEEYFSDYPQISKFTELSQLMNALQISHLQTSHDKIRSIIAADIDTNFSLPAFGAYTQDMSRFGSYRIREIFKTPQSIDIARLSRALQLLKYDYLLINRRSESFTKRKHAAQMIRNYQVILTSSTMAIVYTGTKTSTVVGHIDENGNIISQKPIFTASFFELLSSDKGCNIEGSVTSQKKDFFYDGNYYHTGFGVKAPWSYHISLKDMKVNRLKGIVAFDHETPVSAEVTVEILMKNKIFFSSSLSSKTSDGKTFDISLPENADDIVFQATVSPDSKKHKNINVNWMNLQAYHD